ncbi:MAG: hypothetical protein WBD40_22910 [Tepidisphaeraceae bacterium]
MQQQNPPAEFRDRLLGAQQTTPALREEYRRELDALLNHTLTPGTRLLTWGGIVAAIAFIGLCVRALLVHGADPQVRVIQPTFIVAALGFAGWLVLILRHGGFARKTSYQVVEWVGGLALAAIVAVPMLAGLDSPDDPASSFAMLWSIVALIIAFAWGTGNRIAAANLETREHLLRIESRLADLAERLPRKEEPS